MPTPGYNQNNHYVPQFLQQPWCRADGRITVFTAQSSRISISQRAPRYTGFEPNLTALEGASAEERHCIESMVMSPLDSDAALVHRRLLAGEVDDISGEERTTFSHFLLSLQMRTPEAVASIKAHGDRELREELENDQLQYLTERSAEDPDTFFEFVEKRLPVAVRNFGLTVLPQAIMNEPLGRCLFKAEWWTAHLPSERFDLLLGDRPCILTGNMILGDFIVALPLAPDLLFFASNNPSNRELCSRMSTRDLSMQMNRMTVNRAARRVYATDQRHEKLIAKKLGKSKSPSK